MEYGLCVRGGGHNYSFNVGLNKSQRFRHETANISPKWTYYSPKTVIYGYSARD